MRVDDFFKKINPISFMDLSEGYEVETDSALATLAIDKKEEEVVCSFIISRKAGGGKEMISLIEAFAESISYNTCFANLISERLKEMLERRSYVCEERPFSEEANILDTVDVWVKKVSK